MDRQAAREYVRHTRIASGEISFEETYADRCPSSDADADVLADYVLALLQHDGDVASIRKLCEEETQDFLKEEGRST